MMKRAVVLAGGGARGAYQIGVWKALREMGVEYHIVTGSSVGALNGALMVQGDYDLAREMWESITLRDVVDIPDITALGWEEKDTVRDFVLGTVKRGGLDVTPLEHLLHRVVDEERLRASPVEFGLVTTRFPLIHPVQVTKEEIPQGEVVDYLMASATYFPFFQHKEIHGAKYVDGAYADNMPVRLAVACGADEIIAVDLESLGIVPPWQEQAKIRYIHSYWNLGGELSFEPERARRNEKLGYLDALKAYHRLEGKAYAFSPGETAKNSWRILPAIRRIYRRCGLNLLLHCRKTLQTGALRRRYDGRYLPVGGRGYRAGQLMTAAAELAGEAVGVPPDSAYTFEGFHRECLSLWRQKKITSPGGEAMQLRSAYRLLERAMLVGRPPEQLRTLAILAPKALIAAGYLLALEIRWEKER